MYKNEMGVMHMIKETNVMSAFTEEMQPDGSHVTIIDPYSGCQLQCPYCFQMSNSNWSKDILVNANIASILEKQMKKKNGEDLYIGSTCDPYMQLEEEYGLTKKCLEILCNFDAHVYITTKADNQLILRDIEIFKKFKKPITILLGLSNIKQAGKGRDNANIKVANELKKNGIDVWCFITPFLPYVMSLEETIEAVDPNIPIYLDKLRVMTEGNQNIKVYKWILNEHPQYKKEYEKILFHQDETYYKNIIEQYNKDKRIIFMSNVWGA